MKISTRTRYGMRAILELLLHIIQVRYRLRLLPTGRKYLTNILNSLSDNKDSRACPEHRGPHGGYVLAKPPQDIRLSEIFRVLEGPVFTVECVENEQACEMYADCVTDTCGPR